MKAPSGARIHNKLHMSGLAGHMMNPQEDLRLRYEDFVEMLKTENFTYYEKLDGVNIHILKHQGEIRVSRGKKDLETNGIGLDEIDKRFGKSGAKDLFKFAIEYMTPKLEYLREYEGRYTYNCEILKGTTNVIEYDLEGVFVHGIKDWETGEETRTELSIDPITVVKPGEYLINDVLERIKFQLEGMSLGEYYFMRFVEYTGCPHYDVFERLWNGKKLLKAQRDYKYIEENWKTIRYDVVQHIDSFVIEVGEWIKTHAQNPLGHFTQQEKLFKKLPEDYTRDRIRLEVAYRGQDTFEGLVFQYNGTEYKWTGAFAPINKLMW